MDILTTILTISIIATLIFLGEKWRRKSFYFKRLFWLSQIKLRQNDLSPFMWPLDDNNKLVSIEAIMEVYLDVSSEEDKKKILTALNKMETEAGYIVDL